MPPTGKGKVRVSVTLRREVFERIRRIGQELGLKPSQWIAMVVTSKVNHISITLEKSRDLAGNATMLPVKVLDLLEFVYRWNKKGMKPSHKDVCATLGITRNTARKRIRYLRGRGLLLETKAGRRKILELSEKGKALLGKK